MRTHSFFVLIVPFLLLAGCSSGSATLFVHNDGDNWIEVEIDGKKELKVGTGDYEKKYVPFGEHRVTVYRNDIVIFDEVKNFEPHPEGPAWRHYVLDPDRDTRFNLYEMYYYESQEEANSKRSSRKIKGLPFRYWVDVPPGAFAMQSMPVVFSSSGTETKRLAVFAD